MGVWESLRDGGLAGKAVQLAPEAVSLDLDVDQAEVRRLSRNRFCKQNRPRAGAPEFHPLLEFPDDDLVDAEDLQKPGKTGALAAGQDQAGQPFEILRPA